MGEQAERLRQARMRAGFTGPTRAATYFGWKVSAYTHHENGINGFRAPTAEKYARAFHVSAAWLMCISQDAGAGDRLTDLERSVLDALRVMSEDGREAVRALCEHYVGKREMPRIQRRKREAA